jgi:hypothetical protein
MRGVDAPGFVLYGPYVRLAPSTYRVSVTYSSPADAASTVAAFDVARDGVAVIARELGGTGGALQTVTLDLPQTDGDTWEFRVNWFGDHDITVESMTSEPIPSAP